MTWKIFNTLGSNKISKKEHAWPLDLLTYYGSIVSCLQIQEYLGQKMKVYLAKHRKSFASRNYFDTVGLFISVFWSSPHIFLAIITMVSSLVTLFQLMVKWKRAELRKQVPLSRDKQE